MKKLILNLLVMLFLATNAMAQGVKREYIVGYSGFEWYLITKGDKHGAEDKYGNTLIPTEFKKVTTRGNGQNADWFEVTDMNDKIGLYALDGRCVIATNRGYTDFYVYENSGDDELTFGKYVIKCSNKWSVALCDMLGNKKVCFDITDFDNLMALYNSNPSLKKWFAIHSINGKIYETFGLTDTKNGHKSITRGLMDTYGAIIVEPGKYDMICEAGNIILARIGDKYEYLEDDIEPKLNTYNPFKENVELCKQYAYLFDHNKSKTSQTIAPHNNHNHGHDTPNNIQSNPAPVRELQPVQVWNPCFHCGGTGECKYCQGKGKNWYGNSYEDCVICHGNRYCTECHGQKGYYTTEYR